MDQMDNKQLTNKDFFFCYNRDLVNHLISKGYRFITIAKEPRNLKTFTLFYRSDNLEQELKNYNQQQNDFQKVN